MTSSYCYYTSHVGADLHREFSLFVAVVDQQGHAAVRAYWKDFFLRSPQAHFEIATALGNGIRVLVLTPAEILGLTNTDELVDILKQKLCHLVVSGTTIP